MTAKERKETPVKSGVLDYFPDAIQAVAQCSFIGNEQHNPGSKLHWDRAKSGDELDALLRHVIDAGTIDSDGIRHSAKVAWRALANLQKEIEREGRDEYEESFIERSREYDYMYPPNEGSIEADLAEIERERRMDLIGRNGNDGLHYYNEEFDPLGKPRKPIENPATYAEEMIAKSDTRKDELNYLSDKVNINSPDNVTTTRSMYPGDLTITYNEV